MHKSEIANELNLDLYLYVLETDSGVSKLCHVFQFYGKRLKYIQIFGLILQTMYLI